MGGEIHKIMHTPISFLIQWKGTIKNEKMFKSLVAALIAVCISLATVAIPSASADNVVYGDINRDGNVTLSDVVAVNRYLNGMAEISTHEVADVNSDCVINVVDSRIILAYVNRNISQLPTATPSTNQLTFSAMEARQYRVYDYTSNTVETYTLPVSDITTYAMPRIGVTDDRDWDDDTAVVQILPCGGTGFIIDDHIIATAAHCLYDYDNSCYTTNVEVVIRGAQEGEISEELLRCNAVEGHIPRTFIESSVPDTRLMYDYALIYVEEDLSGYGMFNLGVPSDEFMGRNATVTVSGFPGNKVDPELTNAARFSETGSIVDIRNNRPEIASHQLQFDCYFSNGQSGGPVYMTTTFNNITYRTVVGIATSGGRYDNDYDGIEESYAYYGTRMTPSLLHFYYDNDYIAST